MAWRFEPGEGLRKAFRRVAKEEIARVRAALVAGDDRQRAIHESRQAFKRLRAMLRLAKQSLGSDFGSENRRLREAGRLLSGSRDTTVTLECFDGLVSGRRGLSAAKVRALRARLARNGFNPGSDDARDKLVEVLRLVDEAGSAVDSLAWPDRPSKVLRGLSKGQKRLRQDWREAGRETGAEALHSWRKRVKDQTAQLRLLRRLMPKEVGARIDCEKETAELLGSEHDLFLLAERLGAEPLPADLARLRDILLEEIAAKRGELRDAALRRGEAFAADKPKDFVHSVEAAWAKGVRHAGRKRPDNGGKRRRSAGSATSPAT